MAKKLITKLLALAMHGGFSRRFFTDAPFQHASSPGSARPHFRSFRHGYLERILPFAALEIKELARIRLEPQSIREAREQWELPGLSIVARRCHLPHGSTSCSVPSDRESLSPLPETLGGLAVRQVPAHRP